MKTIQVWHKDGVITESPDSDKVIGHVHKNGSLADTDREYEYLVITLDE